MNAVILGKNVVILYSMPKQYYSFDEYSVDESDDDRYSYTSDKSDTRPCRCNKCHKIKRCEKKPKCYKCGTSRCDKYDKHYKDKSTKSKSSNCCTSEEKCIIIKIRPCK